MVISQNTVLFKFHFIFVTFQSGSMAFLTSIHCCPGAPQTKQRENLRTAIPAVNSLRRINKICKYNCVSWAGCRINTTEPNQNDLGIIVLWCCLWCFMMNFSNIKVMKIELSAFVGDTRYKPQEARTVQEIFCIVLTWFQQKTETGSFVVPCVYSSLLHREN